MKARRIAAKEEQKKAAEAKTTEPVAGQAETADGESDDCDDDSSGCEPSRADEDAENGNDGAVTEGPRGGKLSANCSRPYPPTETFNCVRCGRQMCANCANEAPEARSPLCNVCLGRQAGTVDGTPEH